MYGKIINGELLYAPREFIEDEKRIIGFTDDFLKARGYKEIIFVSNEDEEHIYTYKETEDFIYEE